MSRLTHAWRELEREQRLAALTSLGLFVSMFLPWYSKANTFVEHGAAKATQTSLSAFQAFSFVEAAVLLVSAGVLTLLFRRAEGGDFQLPGGDGLVVMVAGAWAALLIFYRLLDKPGLKASQTITATVGVEWGIFIALLLALGLLYAGQRMRAEERPEPPLMRRRRGGDGDGGGDGGGSRRAPGGAGVEERPGRSARPIPARAPGARSSSISSSSAATEAVERAGEPTTEAAAPSASSAPPSPAPRGDSSSGGGGSRPASRRPRFPPAPSEQMSFEDPPAPQSPPGTK
jgi:hypothetical protein